MASDFQLSKSGIRQNKILELLSINSAMSNYDLCAALGCSEATIRNDLKALAEAGLITRTRGGASSKATVTLDNFQTLHRIHTNEKEKKAIASFVLASGLVTPHSSIAIDIGSTCYLLAEALSKLDYPIDAAVNSLGIASLLAMNPNIKIALAGGLYYPSLDSFDSATALNFFSNMYFDYYFMGANGISKTNGITCTLQDNENRMPVKKLIAEHSEKVIVLADHSKINKTYMHGVCSISKIAMIITDACCSSEERESFMDLGIPVVFAAS